MLTFFNVLHKRKKAMFKKDPLLKGWDLEPDKNSENYKKMNTRLQEFEKEYIRNQKLKFSRK